MSVLDLLLLLFSVCVSASPLLRRQAPTYSFDGDAPFSVDANTLAAALTCPKGTPSSSAPPVLLVHGTSTTGEESWGDGYVPALSAKGFTPCYVTLPGRAMGDMQVSAEYVAYSLHHLSELSGGLKTAVVSHSQGGPDTQWALQFWPSTQSVTSAFVALSPDFAGIQLGKSNLSDVCIGDLCQASLWQQSAGSNFMQALHQHNFAAAVPTTSIWTQFDGVVSPPQKNAALPSATVVSVQQLCPARLTTHVSMTVDAAAFALALDALQHGGTASVSRVAPQALSVCLRMAAKNMQIKVEDQVQASLNELIDGYLLGSPRVSAEPPLMAYAVPSSEQ